MSSSNNALSFTIDAVDVVKQLDKNAMGLDSYLNSILVKSANQTKDEMKSNAPVGVTRDLKDSVSIFYEVFAGRGNHKATIRPIAKHAPYVEDGTRPHMPPSDALEAWAAAKGIALWPLLLSIKRKGTKAHPFVQPTYETMRRIIPGNFADGVSHYIGGA